MLEVVILITNYVDDSFPGWVECELLDIYGEVHKFREKATIVEKENINSDSVFPLRGVIRCTALELKLNSIIIDTSAPDSVESLAGVTQFEVAKNIVDLTL